MHKKNITSILDKEKTLYYKNLNKKDNNLTIITIHNIIFYISKYFKNKIKVLFIVHVKLFYLYTDVNILLYY